MLVVIVGSCYAAAANVCRLLLVFDLQVLYLQCTKWMYMGEVVAIHLSFPELLNNFYEIWYWLSTLTLLGGALCFGLLNTKF